MMKGVRLAFVVGVSSFLLACSNEDSKVRGEFLSGCIQGGGSKSLCTCAYKKITDKYTPMEIKRLHDFPNSKEFEVLMQDMFLAGSTCRK